MKLLKLLKLLTEPINEDFLMCLETVENLPKKEFFTWALECPENIISSYGLVALERYMENYLIRFSPTYEEIRWLSHLLFSKFWPGTTIESSFRIICQLLDYVKNGR